jgi:hypothetical protein
VRGTQAGPDPNGNGDGRGIEVQGGRATIHRSEVSEVASIGAVAASADMTLEGVLVRDVAAAADGREGAGLVATDALGAPAQLACTGCRVEGVVTAAAFAEASAMVLDGVLVKTVRSDGESRFGRGVVGQRGATVTVTNSRIEGVQEAGVHLVESTGTLDALTIAGVAPAQTDGLFGDGIIVALGSAPISVTGSRIENVARAAIGSFGSTVELGDNDLRCNPLPLNVEAFGGVDTTLVDLGGNLCGCDQPAVCKAVSTGLAPPEALPETDAGN